MATLPSPQAMIPTWDPMAISYSIPIARRTKIDPPRTITLANATLVFDTRSTSTTGDKKVVSRLVLQNLADTAIYIALNQVAQNIDGGYHFVLPANANGAQIDLSNDQPEFVSVIGTNGAKVAVYISYPKETN